MRKIVWGWEHGSSRANPLCKCKCSALLQNKLPLSTPAPGLFLPSFVNFSPRFVFRGDFARL